MTAFVSDELLSNCEACVSEISKALAALIKSSNDGSSRKALRRNLVDGQHCII